MDQNDLRVLRVGVSVVIRYSMRY